MRRAGLLTVLTTLLAILVATPASAGSVPPPPPGPSALSWTVFDHRSGRVVSEVGQHRRYKSASLVKLLVAIDLLNGRAASPSENRLLDTMLEASNDDAASALWIRDGGPAIVTRSARVLGLTETSPPARPGIWGYTTTSTADVTKTYLWLLDRATPRTRDGVLTRLEHYAPCAADGYDQSFGVPSALRGPWAVKQGWADWPSLPASARCHPAPPPRPTPPPPPPPSDPRLGVVAKDLPDDPGDARGGVGVGVRSLHTSGLVDGRGRIVVVLTEVPGATPIAVAARWLTDATRRVAGPGG